MHCFFRREHFTIWRQLKTGQLLQRRRLALVEFRVFGEDGNRVLDLGVEGAGPSGDGIGFIVVVYLSAQMPIHERVHTTTDAHYRT